MLSSSFANTRYAKPGQIPRDEPPFLDTGAAAVGCRLTGGRRSAVHGSDDGGRLSVLCGRVRRGRTACGSGTGHALCGPAADRGEPGACGPGVASCRLVETTLTT